MTGQVQNHYGSSGIVERILASLPSRSRVGDAPFLAEEFFAYDQLHGRELLATQEHAARLNPAQNTHLLDVGCGIGGPARYFASTFNCRVTGIDLTPDFVAAARELTSLCALSEMVDFIEADAAEMPFDANTFDHAYCFYVGMNLTNKPAVMGECVRVLKPGAKMLWTEVTSKGREPFYPLPWSRTANDSHVESSVDLVNCLSNAGFEVLSVEDETQAHLELARRLKAAGVTPVASQVQANAVVLGADFVERRINYIQSLSQGHLASTAIFVRKR